MLTKQQQAEKCYSIGKNGTGNVYLYKLSEKETWSGEDVYWGLISEQIKKYKASGQIYEPDGNHSWEINLNWLKGVVETKRKVVIYSPIKFKFIPRREQPGLSAFSKEIAVLIKAGYVPTIMENNMIQLQSQSDEVDFQDVTEEEIKLYLKQIWGLILRKIADIVSIDGELCYENIENFVKFKYDECYNQVKLAYGSQLSH